MLDSCLAFGGEIELPANLRPPGTHTLFSCIIQEPGAFTFCLCVAAATTYNSPRQGRPPDSEASVLL